MKKIKEESQACKWRKHVKAAEANLNRCAAEAARLRMSYGNYMAARKCLADACGVDLQELRHKYQVGYQREKQEGKRESNDLR